MYMSLYWKINLVCLFTLLDTESSEIQIPRRKESASLKKKNAGHKFRLFLQQFSLILLAEFLVWMDFIFNFFCLCGDSGKFLLLYSFL